MSKFEKTYCSNCGREFGPGDHGYSHCEHHASESEKNEIRQSDQYSPAVKRAMEYFWKKSDEYEKG